MTSQQDKVRGSLIGGAIGDALGYPVEFFDSYASIQQKYGEKGITRFDTSSDWMASSQKGGKAVVSDDTQMTLFTACGLLNARENGGAPLAAIRQAYVEWYFTQWGTMRHKDHECWISNLPELYVRRAPGNTCLSALADIVAGKMPCNTSKGCGGVMRIAPVALYGAVQSRTIEEVNRLAAEASELTHQHPLGYIPSALVAHVIYRLVQEETPTRESCKAHFEEGLSLLDALFPTEVKAIKYFRTLMGNAIKLSEGNYDDAPTIETLIGGGWTAEETVAIACYCTLKYFDDFEQAMIAAVNHSGDSDSTGAVTGNLLGAALGYENIPLCYKTDLEFHQLILHIADDLYQGHTSPYRESGL